jgi:hypothetical protein
MIELFTGTSITIMARAIKRPEKECFMEASIDIK